VPSPFPGMDPFLEHPDFFPGLHDSMVAYIREFLQPGLPEPYYAEIAQRSWVEVTQRYIEPDVQVLRGTDWREPESEVHGGVAVARSAPVVVTIPHDERQHTFVQILARRPNEQLVTTIEVLSLTNKTPGEKGRELYVRKQQEILDSQIHLVEIDLLRGGEHTSSVPRAQAIAKAGPFDYHVSVHRFDHFEDYLVYPIRLAQKLPEIAVPLLPGDGDVPLDFQAVFDRSYDTGPYRRRIRYREMIVVPPLRPDQAEWVNGVLNEKLPNSRAK